MTLCVAWQDGSGTHLASDSRLNFGGMNADVGAKVLRFACRIVPPSGPAATSPSFQRTLGVAFAGSAIASLLVTDALRELLRRVQYVPRYIRPSFDTLAVTVAKFFSAAVESLKPAIQANAQTAFFLTGWCPVEEKPRVYQFRFWMEGDAFRLTYDELDMAAGPHLLGDKNASARWRAEYESGSTPLDALKSVIEDRSIQSVGGAVQYGHLGNSPDQGFEVFGVRDYRLVSDTEAEVFFTFRGLPLYTTEPTGFQGGFHIPAVVKDPFAHQISQLRVIPPNLE